MEKLEEATKYFKENNAYVRLFKEMKNKYISFGEIKGNIVIKKPTNQEKQAFSGLMKKDYSKNNSITINLTKIQQTIDNSKFEGIELVDLLKEYFKEDILTKKENAERYEIELKEFWAYVLEQNKNTYIYDYLNQSENVKDNLYQNIKKYYNKEKEILRKELLNACKGINNLPKEIVRIPVFASRITSNPHGFDKNTLCGRLFILLLCYVKNLPYPKNSEELYEIYYDNNLLVDDVSSMVLCKNIKAFAKLDVETESKQKALEIQKHKGLDGFYEYNEPVFLTLYNLSKISYISPYEKYKKVVITENPAVFMEIMDKCKIKDFPLICTYGQVKLAGIVLLDLLVDAGYMLYYSGDLDPEGIQIADKLKQRYNGKLILLGFDKEIYLKNISNIELSEKRLQRLQGVKSNELKILCEEIIKYKKASYEEKNIDYIIKFIENFVTT